MIRACLLTLLTAAGLTACQTMAEPVLEDALITNPGPETLAEIAGIVSQALSGRKTVLASDILTVKPELIIDPKYVNDRSLQRPDHFRLQTDGSNCHLQHVETGSFYPLTQTRCTPA